jgi:hypothetical protein
LNLPLQSRFTAPQPAIGAAASLTNGPELF